MEPTKIEGQLEIDHERGVIYFHSYDKGITMLRICRVPRPIPKDQQLDITGFDYVNWGGQIDLDLPK